MDVITVTRSTIRPETQTVEGSAPPLSRVENEVRPTGRYRHGGQTTRDLTQGSIVRNLWSLAWPSSVTGAIHTVDLLLEIVWAGFLGAASIAGIGAGQVWVGMLNTTRAGFDASTRAMIARAVGAGDIARANHVAGQSILLNLSVGLTVTAAGLTFAEWLIGVLGVSAGVLAVATTYMQWRFVSTTVNGLLMTLSTILIASGDAITPLKANTVARVLHIIVSPFLIFGWGVPGMGIAGSAVGFATTLMVGVAMTGFALFTARSRLSPAMNGFRPDLPLWWRMLRIGAPASVTSAERSLSELVLVGVVAPFGDLVLAAYAMTQRIQMFVNLGMAGLAQAAGVIVGQNLGAQQVERAHSTIRWAMLFAAAVGSIIGSIFFVFPEQVMGLFSRESALTAVAISWLQIMVLGFVALGVGQVFMHVFNTAGETGLPMVVSLVSIWAVQQPLARILSGSAFSFEILGQAVTLPSVEGIGPLGIAWAIVIALGVRLLVYFPYLWWGPWWRRAV